MTRLPLGGGVVVPGRYAHAVAASIRLWLQQSKVRQASPDVQLLLQDLDAAARQFRELENRLKDGEEARARLALSANETGVSRAADGIPRTTMHSSPSTLTSGAVADRLGVSPQRVRQRCAAGDWPSATRGPHGWVVAEDDLKETA
jgi:seryl-tRNA(Sec) selenium transferase